MASITTTLGIAPRDTVPNIRTHVWANEDGDQCAAVYFQIGTSEFGLNAPAEVLDQLLRDALNALGEAVDAHERPVICGGCGMPATADLCIEGLLA